MGTAKPAEIPKSFGRLITLAKTLREVVKYHSYYHKLKHKQNLFPVKVMKGYGQKPFSLCVLVSSGASSTGKSAEASNIRHYTNTKTNMKNKNYTLADGENILTPKPAAHLKSHHEQNLVYNTWAFQIPAIAKHSLQPNQVGLLYFI